MDKTMLESCIVLVVLLNMIIILLFLKYVNNTKKPVSGNVEKKKTVNPTVFDKDVQYLMFIVDYLTKQAEKNRLVPYQKSNNSFSIINDTVFEEVVMSTTTQAMGFLSEDYRQLINYYVGDVTQFTSTLVYNRITEMVYELNKQTIKKLQS